MSLGVHRARPQTVDFVTSAATAESTDADVTYLLALCKHDQAERNQAKLERARQAGNEVTANDTKAAQGALVAYLAAALLALLSIAGFFHALVTPKTRAFAVPDPERTPAIA